MPEIKNEIKGITEEQFKKLEEGFLNYVFLGSPSKESEDFNLSEGYKENSPNENS